MPETPRMDSGQDHKAPQSSVRRKLGRLVYQGKHTRTKLYVLSRQSNVTRRERRIELIRARKLPKFGTPYAQ